ncbi:DUF1266 domain-containing protein [Streptomyces sp. NPDC052396]|uniref:DUF1266 domain-containing protein n=1 Tax=Streptomyces sp. NPDC052396 TaxID=3365689 RepID=UPI0037CF2236
MAIWNRPAPAAAAPAPPPPTEPPAWQAPTEVERGLYEAKWRGDWDAYWRILASADLFHPMSRAFAEANPGRVVDTVSLLPQVRATGHVYLTHGMLPAPAPDPVFYRTSLGSLAGHWTESVPWLAINPGTPCEALFPATPGHRAQWAEHARRAPEEPPRSLRTLWVGGPLQGPVARGLACGALLLVNNNLLWNSMGYHGSGFTGERRLLEKWWGVTSRADWKSTLTRLLNADMAGGIWEFVLEIRQALSREYGGPIEPAHWREVTGRVMRRQAEAAENRSEAALEAEIRRVGQLIGRITRYEARFRADGLLGEHKQVRSVLSWDYGRASAMARWGLGARFCDLPEAEHAVIEAGRAAQRDYHSWADFSAGYILGRCLHFDDEEFGNWYQDVLEAHRLLMSDPQSPWLTIPWQ